MSPESFDPRTRRLFGFTATAVGIHLVFLLAIELPPAGIQGTPEHVLTVILEGQPVLSVESAPTTSPRPSTSSKSETASTALAEPTPDGAAKAGAADLPSVRELLEDVPEVAREQHKPFPQKPEIHPIFGSGHTVLPPPGRRLLDESVWQRGRLEHHIRYASLDGRGLWIKHFDNGDMQVCEQPYDDPFDHGDDYWPFACDRPSL